MVTSYTGLIVGTFTSIKCLPLIIHTELVQLRNSLGTDYLFEFLVEVIFADCSWAYLNGSPIFSLFSQRLTPSTTEALAKVVNAQRIYCQPSTVNRQPSTMIHPLRIGITDCGKFDNYLFALLALAVGIIASFVIAGCVHFGTRRTSRR